MGENPSCHSKCGSRCPVEMVSWEDVQEFIGSLNERESGRGYRYRLPTEEEREFAARADAVQARYEEFDEVTWFWDNSGRNPHPVGHKRASAWASHDMLGNVWEWTGDWYGGYPTGSGSGRVIRGGSWSGYARFVRSTIRGTGSPGTPYRYVGFRLVRTD